MFRTAPPKVWLTVARLFRVSVPPLALKVALLAWVNVPVTVIVPLGAVNVPVPVWLNEPPTLTAYVPALNVPLTVRLPLVVRASPRVMFAALAIVTTAKLPPLLVTVPVPVKFTVPPFPAKTPVPERRKEPLTVVVALDAVYVPLLRVTVPLTVVVLLASSASRR